MINSILDAITSRFYAAVDWINDPFWAWVWLAIAIMLVVVAVVYFFGGWLPVLKPIGGVILLILGSSLYAYRKGENDRAALDAKRMPKPRPKAPPMPRWPFQ